MPSNFRTTGTAPRLLNALLVHGKSGISQDRLAAEAQVSKRAASDHLKVLRERGIVQREPSGLVFGPGAGLVAAVTFGDRAVQSAVVDANGREHHLQYDLVEGQGQLAEPPDVVLDRVAKSLSRAVRAASKDLGLRRPDGTFRLAGVECAVPSALGRDGIVRGHSLAHGDWKIRRVEDILRDALPPIYRRTPVDVINNANADVVGIAFDRARDRAFSDDRPGEHSHVIIAVRVSDGVGAGTFQLAGYERHGTFSFARSRSLVVGTNGYAGELGHVPVASSDLRSLNRSLLPGLSRLEGVECSCHQRDHLESYVSLTATVRRLGKLSPDLLARSDLDQVLENPDELLRRALSDAGVLLARSLSGTVLMLDPWLITLTGVLGVQALRDGMIQAQHTWSSGTPTRVEIRALDAEERRSVTLRGAAIAMFRRQLYKLPQLEALCDKSKPGATH